MTFLLSSLVKFIDDFHCHLMSKHKVKEQFTLSCALSFIFNFNAGESFERNSKKKQLYKVVITCDVKKQLPHSQLTLALHVENAEKQRRRRMNEKRNPKDGKDSLSMHTKSNRINVWNASPIIKHLYNKTSLQGATFPSSLCAFVCVGLHVLSQCQKGQEIKGKRTKGCSQSSSTFSTHGVPHTQICVCVCVGMHLSLCVCVCVWHKSLTCCTNINCATTCKLLFDCIKCPIHMPLPG